MKKFLALILLVALVWSFRQHSAPLLKFESRASSVLALQQEEYLENLMLVGRNIDSLHQHAAKFLNNEIGVERLKQQVTKTRLSYKTVEYLLEHLDPALVNTFINGAPLPKLEPHVPEVTVIPPKGMQTIDELVFLDADQNKEKIVALAKELQTNWQNVLVYQSGRKLQHRYLIEGARYGVIRIFTLGLTGFDTPGSGNALDEALVSLSTLLMMFENYNQLAKNDSKEVLQSIKQKLELGIEKLKLSDDFEQLDRLGFLMQVINPLYQLIYDFQKTMGIEFGKEVDPTLSAHNYDNREIFDASFFNNSFYTGIASSDLEDDKKIDLGRLLFFDPVLSKDLSMSCASCHRPDKGFADGLSRSITNRPNVFTARSSPSLLNSAIYGRYFWDMREYDLERQIKHVVHNEIEFNIDFLDLVDRLKESSEYRDRFNEAYGGRDKYVISTWSISNALAAYINSLTSFNSPIDKYIRGDISELEEEVKNGFNVFMGKAACGTCHFAPAFNGTVPPYYQDSESEVLGVPVTFDTVNPVLDQDPGRLANGLPEEQAPHFHRSFKTVTVRNAGITAPFMHNGGMATLEDVVEFYNRGGGSGMGLDVPHQTLPETKLDLTKEEISDLVKFMQALTDTSGLTQRPQVFPKFENRAEWDNRGLLYD